MFNLETLSYKKLLSLVGSSQCFYVIEIIENIRFRFQWTAIETITLDHFLAHQRIRQVAVGVGNREGKIHSMYPV